MSAMVGIIKILRLQPISPVAQPVKRFRFERALFQRLYPRTRAVQRCHARISVWRLDGSSDFVSVWFQLEPYSPIIYTRLYFSLAKAEWRCTPTQRCTRPLTHAHEKSPVDKRNIFGDYRQNIIWLYRVLIYYMFGLTCVHRVGHGRFPVCRGVRRRRVFGRWRRRRRRRLCSEDDGDE